jgi:threonyl-tRNA synthetase
MLVMGDKEIENGQVALRLRNGENPGPMPVSAFVELAKDEVARKV